jgi:hypothetical protein
MSNCERIHQICGRKNQIDWAALAAVLNQWSERSTWASSCSRLSRSGSGSCGDWSSASGIRITGRIRPVTTGWRSREQTRRPARPADREWPATRSSNRARVAGDGGRERWINQWTAARPSRSQAAPTATQARSTTVRPRGSHRRANATRSSSQRGTSRPGAGVAIGGASVVTEGSMAAAARKSALGKNRDSTKVSMT